MATRKLASKLEPAPDCGPVAVELTLPARLALLDAAAALYADLGNQVDYVVHALDCLHRGEMFEAAWHFWLAGMSKREPECVYDEDEAVGWRAAS